MEFKHTPVMLEEVIEGLNIKEDGIYVEELCRDILHDIRLG